MFQISTTSNWHEVLQVILEGSAGYWAALYFLPMYVILHMVIINLFVAISYEAYNKFVSKPKQARSKSEPQGEKPRGVRARLRMKFRRVGNCFTVYTAGSRRSISSSPRVHRPTTVTIRRKSLAGMHDKLSDSSLGDKFVGDSRPNGAVQSRPSIDLTNVPPEKKHEMILKQRMQQKAEARGRRGRARPSLDGSGTGFADVVRVYSAKTDDELSLSPGQKVQVIETVGTLSKGTIMSGPQAGKKGWFPTFALGAMISEGKAAQEKRAAPKTDTAPKLVKKQNADWTKDIIGPMTIMNPEELKELNKILKANARGARASTDMRSSAGAGSPTSPSPATTSPRVGFKPALPTVMQIVDEDEEEDEEEDENAVNEQIFAQISKLYKRTVPLPEVIIQQASIVLEEEEVKEQDEQHLRSPKRLTPEMRAKEKWRKKKKRESEKKRKGGGGDIPDWAKKFMQQSNVKVSQSPETDQVDSVDLPQPDNLAGEASSSVVIENDSAGSHKLSSSNSLTVRGANPQEFDHRRHTLDSHKAKKLPLKSKTVPLIKVDPPHFSKSASETRITVQPATVEQVEDYDV